VLFIGTQFSNLYTAVDTPARGRGCDQAPLLPQVSASRVQYCDLGWLRCPPDLSEDGSKGRAQGKEEGALSDLDDEWILFGERQVANPSAQDKKGALAISPTIVANSTHTLGLP
jgi:hypothetical protein